MFYRAVHVGAELTGKRELPKTHYKSTQTSISRPQALQLVASQIEKLYNKHSTSNRLKARFQPFTVLFFFQRDFGLFY